ncbi:MAG: epoxyqueuosine reductase QueH [Nitrospinota bacterium]
MQDKREDKPPLLLHICCAPCSPHVVDLLKNSFRLTAYFYGPNIQPESEYLLRLDEAKVFAEKIGLRLILPEYDTKRWFHMVRGHEKEREGGGRCRICYRFRLEKTAQFAFHNSFTYFATVLSVSPHKDAAAINKIGLKLALEYGLRFFEADFKKRDGFKLTVRKGKEFGFYRQNYCGCIFSRRDVWGNTKNN